MCGLQQRGVAEQEFRAGMLDDLGDLDRGQPGVQGDQHTPGERDGEMRDQHLGAVRREVGHPVTRL